MGRIDREEHLAKPVGIEIAGIDKPISHPNAPALQIVETDRPDKILDGHISRNENDLAMVIYVIGHTDRIPVQTDIYDFTVHLHFVLMRISRPSTESDLILLGWIFQFFLICRFNNASSNR